MSNDLIQRLRRWKHGAGCNYTHYTAADEIEAQAKRIAELVLDCDTYEILVDRYVNRIAELEALVLVRDQELYDSIEDTYKANKRIAELESNPLYDDRIALHQAYMDRGKRIAELEVDVQESHAKLDEHRTSRRYERESQAKRIAELEAAYKVQIEMAPERTVPEIWAALKDNFRKVPCDDFAEAINTLCEAEKIAVLKDNPNEQ
jgi:hypothetical protein